jgi:hypothetical protein
VPFSLIVDMYQKGMQDNRYPTPHIKHEFNTSQRRNLCASTSPQDRPGHAP